MIDSEPIRLNASPPSKPCHNCRRRRLRCDRSIPECHKCVSKGEKCLGYGNLIRWTNAVALRGNLPDQISQHQSQCRSKEVIISHHARPKWRQKSETETQTLQLPLTDPLLINLAPQHRLYIGHCESHQPESYSAASLISMHTSDCHPKSSDTSAKT